MKTNQFKTAEFVSASHPDKICDFIADSILDAYLNKDKNSQVAIEVMAGHGKIYLSGEVKSQARINYEKLVKKILPNYKIYSQIKTQSPEIARAIKDGGAGDQGIMIGYACLDNCDLIPQEHYLARNLCREIYKKYPYDGKVQITLKDNQVYLVLVSWQKIKSSQLLKLTKELIKSENYLVNPAGDWQQGGLEADSGLSGRKIVVDAYGPEIPVGGGSFSGKDYTKVDRSGAYMARKVAVKLLKKYQSQQVLVKLAYAIGKKDVLMAQARIDNKIIDIRNLYDFSPGSIREKLNLDSLEYNKLSNWGHFGRQMIWDQ